MSSDIAAETELMPEPAPAPGKGRGLSVKWFTLIGGAIALNIFALIFFPPFPKGGEPGQECAFPACYIEGSLEFPAPHVVWDPDPSTAPPADQLLTFHVSITSTILTMWIVIVIVLVGSILMARGRKMIPGRGQNLFEWFYETLSDFGVGLAGPRAVPYVPIFAGFFLLILFSNWIGLVPPVGKIEALRAPTSDVNITIGLALVAFLMFEGEGFRRLGVRGYLGKFFPLGEFRKGIATGGIALFVGLVELMLEFVKPLTLSMRLFGNVYGGEVALGVITALTLSFIPVGLLGLEVMLNFIQALIFSILTLMFIVLAIESHHEDEVHVAEDEASVPGSEPALQPAH